MDLIVFLIPFALILCLSRLGVWLGKPEVCKWLN